MRIALPALATSALVAGLLVSAPPAPADEPSPSPAARPTAKIPTAVGYGGAVSTVDPEASAAALKILKKGGNAADAAVAAAATLGVTEPYSAGIGGGGYFVHYDAKTGEVSTIDGRETAPAKMPTDAFVDPATGKPYPFTPDLVTSGVSVGVPGTPGHLGARPQALRHAVDGQGAQAGHRGRPARLRRRRHLPPADAGQRGALQRLLGQPPALPPRRRRTRGRLDLQEPAARRRRTRCSARRASTRSTRASWRG